MDPSTRPLIALFSAVAVLLYFLPTFIAIGRDVVARPQIIALNVLLGWTGAAWICALVLSFGPRRPRPPAQPPTRPVPQLPVGPDIYRDGVYLASSGPDSHTWAIREDGRWRIVYEVGGAERLVGEVAEADVPLDVLAAALEPSERVR